ncbi:MAG: hypothetical protein BWY09_01781 [Candidatus Hydrogenedentes bacterium ADurb.Bin179]|nr:MAG: hypothetical protein BWY09_01781 [Candidatus Hydrogenedentes bacterium ADurb.Bin179]
MARLTSSGPLINASRMGKPRDRWRRMFSTTTMELSTSMPTEMIIDTIVMILSDMPAKNMNTNANTSDVGMEKATSAVGTNR